MTFCKVRLTFPATLFILVAGFAVTACAPAPLAEADGRALSVEEAARLIDEHSTLPPDTQVVRALAELWVDYSLLTAHLAADTSLSTLDVELVTEPPRVEMTLARLRDEVLEVDTVITEDELAERFAAELPGARATASQILLAFPRGATARQRDSVLTFANSLRAQLDDGADFATLAQRYSADPGSGSRGGSLGTFGRGQMLRPIDETVFSLGPGDLGGPVETVLGYHLVRLDALEVPELSEVAGEFRARIQTERMAQAEGAYIMQLDSLAGLALAEDAVAITRALLGAAPSRLSGSAAARPILTWMDGSFTTGDFMELVRNSAVGFAESVAEASDEELESALLRLGREELLIEEAHARGITPSGSAVDSLSAEARGAIRERAARIGLTPRPIPAPDSAAAAADSVEADPISLVESALIRVVSGEQEIVPLGAITLLLRDQGDWRIHHRRIGQVLALLREPE